MRKGILPAVVVLVLVASSCGGDSRGPSPSITAIDPNSGGVGGGTDIVISGTNFQDGANIRFQGLQAPSVVFNSATRLSARTPRFSQQGGVISFSHRVDVTVANPDGLSADLPLGFWYLDCNAPPGSVCPG